MRIKKIRLKNGYKRFRDLTIDLGEDPARIVALVGPNGCGKSSVLDGILFQSSPWGPIGNTQHRDFRYHSMDANPSYDYQNIQIELVQGNFLVLREERQRYGTARTMLSFRSPYRYNNQVKITETRSTTDIKENNYGASDAASLDSKMEENYRRLQAMVNRYMQENDVRPSEAREKIIGELNSSIRNCLDLEVKNIGNVEASQGTLYFGKSGHKTTFEFNVLSSGEKEVVDILLDLYLRKQDYNDSIFLIDEPELHINTSIQGKLLTEIDRLIGPECQIWLTTHSIGFLRAIQMQMKDKCQVVQFRATDDYASKEYTLTPIKPTAAAWRELFEIALDDLANLVSPKTIIYCEGRAEPGKLGHERGMDARAFNIIFGEAYPETLFVSSGGNTELDQRSTVALAILSKVFPSVEVLLLKDRDMASGKPTTENDRQVYLTNNPDHHRVMKRFEIENYLFDKDVLKAYCLGNNLNFDEAAYDSFVTDVVNQDVKRETARIRNFCGVTGSVTPDNFKLALAPYLTAGMPAYAELEGCIFART